MNVLFHLAAGFGIALAVCNEAPKPKVLITATGGAFIAFVSHALLDYTPHCYPINSKVDFIAGFIILLSLVFFARREYRLILLATLCGSVLPDLIDLLPAILNKQLHLNLPIYPKLFPWHWKAFSGSVYDQTCSATHINFILTGLCLCAMMIIKIRTIKKIYFHRN